MEDVDKEPEERKTTLQNLLFFVEKFEGHKTGVGHDVNSWEQQQAPQDVKYDNETVQQQQQQNQYEVGKTDTGIYADATDMTYVLSIRELGCLN